MRHKTMHVRITIEFGADGTVPTKTELKRALEDELNLGCLSRDWTVEKAAVTGIDVERPKTVND